MTKKRLYVALTDINLDSDIEFDTLIYADAYVQQCLNFILNAVFSRISWDYSIVPQYELEKFLMQWLIDGYSAIYQFQTLNNEDIVKVVKIDGEWNITLRLKRYTSLDDWEYVNVAIVHNIDYINPKDYDEVYDAKYLIYRKRLIDTSRLLDLVQRKKEMEDLLRMCTKKGIIPTIIAYTTDLDDEYIEDVLKFLKDYENGSCATINTNFIQKIDVIEPKLQTDILFNEIDRINKEICFILGLSDNLFTAKGTELATSRVIENTISANINSYIDMIVNVLREIEVKNDVDLNVSVVDDSNDE